MEKIVLAIAAIFIGFISIAHLARLFWSFPIIIGTYSVPKWVSFVAFLVAGFVSVWLFLSL